LHPYSIMTLFGKKICDWYPSNARPLPWRETKNPYFIWLSEIILQQTRVDQGLPYYNRFITLFPDVHALASAKEEEVLKAWEGLGYYSRARNLHKAAQEVAFSMGGIFPETSIKLADLKGIGPYTANAIASFAFGEAVPVVDGNVFRVISRALAVSFPVDQSNSRKHYTQIASEWLGNNDPFTFNQGIMELGATVCLPRNPLCSACPLVENCKSYVLGNQMEFPVKGKKLAKGTRNFKFFLIQDEQGRFLVRRRASKGLWGGLWELPNEEFISEPEGLFAREPELNSRFLFRHQLTHFNMDVYLVDKKPENDLLNEEYRFISKSEIHIFAFSRAVLKIFEHIGISEKASGNANMYGKKLK